MSRVDIVDVIDQYVPLKKAGKEYQACCPFHSEKTPSFTVSPQKQFYHCFGCGAHGTAIGFLLDFAQLEFVDAVAELARRAGMEVPVSEEQATTGARRDWQALRNTLEEAAAYFRRQLRSHPAAQSVAAYLKNRGLSGETARHFNLGFAPPGWENLQQALGDGVEKRRLMATAGLVSEGESGKTFDRFRNRVMFPIADYRGRTVGFGARAIGNEDSGPKYLNSPETPLFHKGRELYGLFHALKGNPNLDRLLVVEGYMDVLVLAQYGITNVVATLGTAVTREHLEKLYRSVPEIVFCFDGDEAGRRAAWKALETALPLMSGGRQASFLFLPEGEDPDSLVRNEGAEAFSHRLEATTGLAAFLFDRLQTQAHPSTLDGRARLVELGRPLLGRIPPGAFRQLAIQRLSALSGIAVPELSTLMAERPATHQRQSVSPAPSGRMPLSLVRRTLMLLLQNPGMAALVPDRERLGTLSLPGVPLLMELLELLEKYPHFNAGMILEHFRSHEEGQHLTKLMRWDVPIPTEGLAEEFSACVASLFAAVDEQRLEYLSRKDREKQLSPEEKQEFGRLLTRSPH